MMKEHYLFGFFWVRESEKILKMIGNILKHWVAAAYFKADFEARVFWNGNLVLLSIHKTSLVRDAMSTGNRIYLSGLK